MEKYTSKNQATMESLRVVIFLLLVVVDVVVQSISIVGIRPGSTLEGKEREEEARIPDTRCEHREQPPEARKEGGSSPFPKRVSFG
jgi:hypothetical protein